MFNVNIIFIVLLVAIHLLIRHEYAIIISFKYHSIQMNVEQMRSFI